MIGFTEKTLPGQDTVDSRKTITARVVQFKGKRRSFRLENTFWDALSSIAKRRKIRVGKLVDEIAQRHVGQNLTSALRVECILDLERQLFSARLTKGDVKSEVIDLSPAPCVLLSESATILGGNKAFERLFSKDSDEFVGIRFTEVFKVQTAKGFQDFWLDLQRRPNRTLAAHIVLSSSRQLVAGEATFISDLNKAHQFIGATVWISATNSRRAPAAA